MARSSAAEAPIIALSPATHHEPIVLYLAALRVMTLTTLRMSSEASTTPADSTATSVLAARGPGPCEAAWLYLIFTSRTHRNHAFVL
jgi:hypothetical protein